MSQGTLGRESCIFHVTILTLNARGWVRLGDLVLCAEGIDGDEAFEADGLEGQ